MVAGLPYPGSWPLFIKMVVGLPYPGSWPLFMKWLRVTIPGFMTTVYMEMVASTPYPDANLQVSLSPVHGYGTYENGLLVCLTLIAGYFIYEKGLQVVRHKPDGHDKYKIYWYAHPVHGYNI
jgi:hypothetical protein